MKISKLQKLFIDNLLRDIDVIKHEVENFLHKENVYQTRIIPSLERINPHGALEVTRSHYESMLVDIRRQLGVDKNEISILRIMNKLIGNPQWITEEWYVQSWLKDSSLVTNITNPVLKGFTKGIPAQEFKNHFGKTGIIDTNIVEEDKKQLIEITSKIKTFVDKRLAHTDKTVSQIMIEETEYKSALKTIEKLTLKYILLLKQVGMPNLTPVIQVN